MKESVQRLILSILWWIWGMGLFALMIPLSLQPAIFGQDTQKVWQWFLPNILPTLTMVGAVAYQDAPSDVRKKIGIIFGFAIITSVSYLIALTVTILAGAFYSPSPLESLRGSSLWLAPLQGFASSSLAFFFVKNARMQK